MVKSVHGGLESVDDECEVPEVVCVGGAGPPDIVVTHSGGVLETWSGESICGMDVAAVIKPLFGSCDIVEDSF